MKKLLLTALHKILAADGNVGHTFKKSGNLLNKLKDLGEDAAKDLSDTYYERTAKEKETSEKGYLLGRLNRTKKTVYRIEYPPNIFYFIGTEADILRKISEYEEKQGEQKEEKKEDKEEKSKTEIEYEQSKEELSEIFK